MKAELSPNYHQMVQKFNQISNWVAYEIVSQQDISERVETLQYFIKLTKVSQIRVICFVFGRSDWSKVFEWLCNAKFTTSIQNVTLTCLFSGTRWSIELQLCVRCVLGPVDASRHPAEFDLGCKSIYILSPRLDAQNCVILNIRIFWGVFRWKLCSLNVLAIRCQTFSGWTSECSWTNEFSLFRS